MRAQELDPLTELTNAARVRLHQTDLVTASPDALLDELLTLAEGQEDYTATLQQLEHAIQSTQRWHVLLQEMYAQVQSLQAQHEEREQYSEKWWEHRRTSLEKALQVNQEQGWRQWLIAFTTTLLDWELEMCLRFIDTSFDVPNVAQPTLNVLHWGVDALIDEQPADALEMFTLLTQDDLPGLTQSLDNELRSTLFVRIGQIHLYEKSQSVTARVQFNLAQTLAPADGRPIAAMGDYHRVQSELDQAERLYQQAIDLSPNQPEGFIGMGLLAEKQGWWDEAEAWYAQAIVKVQSARSVNVALRRAIGFTAADGTYADRLRHRFSGMLHEVFGQPEEAALSYYEAGVRYHWRQESLAALDLLRKSSVLDNNHTATYWQLSDALLSVSYRQTPPFVEAPFIHESLQVWEEGAARGFKPDASQAWSYTSRALINEQLNRLPEDLNRALLWWEGIAFFERALLLADTNSYTWSYLSRYHHNLEHEACAVQAFEKALEHAPDDEARAVALGEQATLLANIGYLEEAKVAVDAYLTLKDDVWIKGTQAFVLAFTREYEISLDILDALVAATPENMWYREVRTFCYRRLGRIDDVIADCQWMWDLRDHPDYANQRSAIGWAAFSLFLFGNYGSEFIDYAIEMYLALPEEDYPSMILRNLGMFYLAKGDIAEGERYLLEGIRATASFRELDEMRDADLADLLRYSASLPHHNQIRESLETLILPAIEVRRAEIGERKTPLEEMRWLRDTARRHDPAEGWMLIGAQAGLARLYVDQGQLGKAADIYQELRAETYRFPEATDGLCNIAAVWRNAGDAQLQDGQPGEAQRLFTQAIALDAFPDDFKTQASLHVSSGLSLLELHLDNEARAAFTTALDLHTGRDHIDPGKELGLACGMILRDTAHYWTVDAAWDRWLHDPGIEDALASHLPTARETLRKYLDHRYKLSQGDDERTPIVTPIALELGDRLIPNDPGPEWALIKTYLPEMRTRILDETGVNVPGVRVRSSDNFDAQDYVILINDVPTVSGSVESAGDGSLTDIVRHLESVLHQNLADYLGMQEVENLLENWGQTTEDKAYIAKVLPNTTVRFRFARVLRDLVAEQVPITQWRQILETVEHIGLDDEDVTPVVSAIRQKIKAQLPGNAPRMQHIELPSDLEDQILSRIQHRHGRTFLALPPETAQALLDWLRPHINASDQNAALIVRTSDLRPYLYRLVRLEYPYIQVLARDEVLDVPKEAGNARQ